MGKLTEIRNGNHEVSQSASEPARQEIVRHGDLPRVFTVRRAERRERRTFLPPELAGKIVFKAFELSQGEPFLQSSLFRYLHAAYPEWKFPDFDATKASVTKRVYDFFFQHPPKDNDAQVDSSMHDNAPTGTTLTKANLDTSIDNEVRIMRRIFTKEKPRDRTSLLRHILVESLAADRKFISSKRGRQRAIGDHSKHPFDPRSSNTIEFALRGRSTTVPEFDEMFRELSAYIRNPQNHQSQFWFANGVGELLDEVIQLYNQYHQDSPFSLEQQT